MKSSECDIAIPELKTAADEQRAANALRNLPGVGEVRVTVGGVSAAYRADTISPDAICESLRQAGFHPSIFQDSATGRTGLSSS